MTTRAVALTIAALLGGGALGAPASAQPAAPAKAPAKAPAATPDAPPATLVSGAPTKGAALDAVFGHLKLDRLSCTFTEEKRIALLARPLQSSGTIYFDKAKGVSRTTQKPKVEQVVLTATTLRIKTAKKTEEIPLSKSKDLKAFAAVFPSVLRGDRVELARSFDIGVHGSDKDWWALELTPKTDSMKKMIKRVVVYGRKKDPVSLQITEANGDTTNTKLTNIKKNDDVPDTEIATAFGAS